MRRYFFELRFFRIKVHNKLSFYYCKLSLKIDKLLIKRTKVLHAGKGGISLYYKWNVSFWRTLYGIRIATGITLINDVIVN